MLAFVQIHRGGWGGGGYPENQQSRKLVKIMLCEDDAWERQNVAVQASAGCSRIGSMSLTCPCVRIW